MNPVYAGSVKVYEQDSYVILPNNKVELAPIDKSLLHYRS